MTEFLASNCGLIGTVVLVMLAVNVTLTGLKQGLELIKDKTTTEVDNKAHDFLSKVLDFLGKVLDTIGHNPEHK